MQFNKNVFGSLEASAPIIVNHDNVYLHSNVHQEEAPEEADEFTKEMYGNMYVYDEIVMTKDEYIVYLQDHIDELQKEISQQNIEVKLAIAELGTMIGA